MTFLGERKFMSVKDKQTHIAIVGAGLVGSLLSIYLSRRGYRVSVFDRRPDPRTDAVDRGRSINLALSNRGIRALDEVGVMDEVRRMAIPMHGRMMHDRAGNLSFLPYGRSGQFINSISRKDLNVVLLQKAASLDVDFYFQHRCLHADFDKTEIQFEYTDPNVAALAIGRRRRHKPSTARMGFDLIIGADGAFSAVRSNMQITDRFNYSQEYINHGYKELSIPAEHGSSLEKNALHIWPRESFMMIALPNMDGSFTCTLFYPFNGQASFELLDDEKKIKTFFSETFPDAYQRMPDLMTDFGANPTSSLVTVTCFPWVKKRTLLIGDAAHAIVPFYGQGMNAGFEDCRILNELLDKYNDAWESVLEQFQNLRKPDADAIARLALDNFIEMRDLVADPDFLLRKKIESKLHELYPDRWIPLYSMVTFNEDIRYSTALLVGQRQKQIMDEVMKLPGINNHWQQLNFEEIVARLR